MTDTQSREKEVRSIVAKAIMDYEEEGLQLDPMMDRIMSAFNSLASHPTPKRDEHITRMLDQLSGGVGTFLQADGERLVEYVRALEDNGARTQALYDVLNNMCVRTATTYPGKTETFSEAVQWMKENVIDNLVRKQNEINRQAHRACTAENELADLRRQLAERDVEIKQIRLPWQPFSTVPHEALDIEALDENGDIDEISWSNQRYCMLGSPQGSRGAGWVSHLCGHLPVDGPFTHWRPKP